MFGKKTNNKKPENQKKSENQSEEANLSLLKHLNSEVLPMISNNHPMFGNEEFSKFMDSQRMIDISQGFVGSFKKAIVDFYTIELPCALQKNYRITSVDLRMKIKDIFISRIPLTKLLGLINNSCLSTIFFDSYTNMDESFIALIMGSLQNNFSITTFHQAALESDYLNSLFQQQVKVLTDRNMILQKDFFAAVKECCLEEVKSILLYTSNKALFFRDSIDAMNTALHLAVELKHIELIKLLLARMQRHKVPLDMRNSVGKTASELASTEEIQSLFNSETAYFERSSSFFMKSSDSGSSKRIEMG